MPSTTRLSLATALLAGGASLGDAQVTDTVSFDGTCWEKGLTGIAMAQWTTDFLNGMGTGGDVQATGCRHNSSAGIFNFFGDWTPLFPSNPALTSSGDWALSRVPSPGSLDDPNFLNSSFIVLHPPATEVRFFFVHALADGFPAEARFYDTNGVEIARVFSKEESFHADPNNFVSASGEIQTVRYDGGWIDDFSYTRATPTDPCEGKTSLCAPVRMISQSSPTMAVYEMNAGPEHAGKVYIATGSASGTSPGFTLPVVGHVPLNIDGYFGTMLANANKLPFDHTLGVLDDQGRSYFRLCCDTIAPSMIGMHLDHAYFVLGPQGGVQFVSETDYLDFVP